LRASASFFRPTTLRRAPRSIMLSTPVGFEFY
jgi:hypothetical protein